MQVSALLSGIVALSAFGHVAGATDPYHYEPRMTAEELEVKALRLQSIVEERTLQEHGLIPMFVRAEDYQLPTAADYDGAYRHRHLHGKTEEEIGLPPMHVWRAWENTSADTAFYLGAMSYRYRCTGDPAVLAICRRTLGGLKHIYEMGVEHGEPGFICKPYGGKFSRQTSGDQVQCVISGLSAYYPIAPPEDRATVDQMVRDMSDNLIENGYTPKWGYFAYPPTDLDWSKADWTDAVNYLPVLHAAWTATGDDKYLHEKDRWYRHCDIDNTWTPPSGTFTGHLGYRMTYLPSQMMVIDPRYREVWRSYMLATFRNSSTGVTEDGTTYTSWLYESDTGEIQPRNPGWGGGPAKTARSSILAKGLVSTQRWFLDEPMVEVARKILEGLDEGNMRFVLPIDEQHPLPSEWQVESTLLDHDVLTTWLWAYWEGRWRGYW